MAYKYAAPYSYPLRRENARFFSQELMEFVLLDFGHIWKPQRSARELRLRETALYVFSPDIGRLVAYMSRRYSGFIVKKCLEAWNYVNSLRPSMRQAALCNEIGTFCKRADFRYHEVSLPTFMAMTAEYARLAIISKQENLIDPIVDSLTLCLTNVIPGGYIVALERIKNLASKYEYAQTGIVQDYDPDKPFKIPVSRTAKNKPKCEFESPFAFEYNFPLNAQYSMTVEEIEDEVKKRESQRIILKRKLMVDSAIQTSSEDDESDLECIGIKSENSMSKVDYRTDENLDDSALGDVYFVAERRNTSVQTTSSDTHLNYDSAESDKTVEKTADFTTVIPDDVHQTVLEAASEVVEHMLNVTENLMSEHTCSNETEAEDGNPDDKIHYDSPMKESSKPTQRAASSEFADKEVKISEASCTDIK